MPTAKTGDGFFSWLVSFQHFGACAVNGFVFETLHDTRRYFDCMNSNVPLKINYLRGDLTDVSAITITLLST